MSFVENYCATGTYNPKGFDVEVELNYYIERTGYEIVEVPIGYRTRLGEKKLKPKDGAAILKRVIIGATTTNILKDSHNT